MPFPAGRFYNIEVKKARNRNNFFCRLGTKTITISRYYRFPHQFEVKLGKSFRTELCGEEIKRPLQKTTSLYNIKLVYNVKQLQLYTDPLETSLLEIKDSTIVLYLFARRGRL